MLKPSKRKLPKLFDKRLIWKDTIHNKYADTYTAEVIWIVSRICAAVEERFKDAEGFILWDKVEQQLKLFQKA